MSEAVYTNSTMKTKMVVAASTTTRATEEVTSQTINFAKGNTKTAATQLMGLAGSKKAPTSLGTFHAC